VEVLGITQMMEKQDVISVDLQIFLPKVYILKDFGLASSQRVYMKTLVRLNIIKQVDALYKNGAGYFAYHQVKGYKLK
jgi:hypothetical protein